MGLVHDVHAFLSQLDGSEPIDALRTAAAERAQKKADYFLFDRRVVVEVKEFVDNREAAVGVILDELQANGMLRVSSGEPLIQDVLRDHPQREVINAQLLEAATSNLEGAIRDANRQVRGSRITHGAPEAIGMLILVNEHVDILDPKVVAAAVDRALSKRVPDGSQRFPAIESVALIATAHRVVGEEHALRDVVLTMGLATRDRNDAIREVERRLSRAWAESRGVPFTDGGPLDNDGLLKLPIAGKRPPTAL